MDIISLIFFFLVITFSAVIHEYSHGWMADRLGDPTARLAGRLTLNPIAHIDPFGTFLLPALLFLGTGGRMLFAYAKPVPVNPYNLKNSRYGSAYVAIAGPASNIILAFVFGMMVRVFPDSVLTPFWAIIVFSNVLLAVFNLVPIPPLDGSKVLFSILPSQFNNFKVFLEAYGWMFLLFFIFFFFQMLIPVIQFFFTLFAGQAVLP